MLGIAIFATLVLFTLVMSQHCFFLVALGRATDALSAPAYVELRQRINAIMNVRLLPLYGATLVSAGLLAWLAFARGEPALAWGTLAAIAGLIADAALALWTNVPINAQMDRWSPDEPPPDWATHRARWTAAFATRQAVLSIAYTMLLAGVVAGR